ncbi:MAG: PadR family transcriptional regulator [Cyclobacteriaceae bacterium]
MKENSLGELQELVLLVIGNLNTEAYGLAIKEFIRERLKRPISISAVHATLQRLEKKGLVTSAYDKTATSERGGRPKLVFSITAHGQKTLEEVRAIRNQLWDGMYGLGINPQT